MQKNIASVLAVVSIVIAVPLAAQWPNRQAFELPHGVTSVPGDFLADGSSDVYVDRTITDISNGITGRELGGLFPQSCTDWWDPQRGGVTTLCWPYVVIGYGDFNRDGKVDIVWNVPKPPIAPIPTSASQSLPPATWCNSSTLGVMVMTFDVTPLGSQILASTVYPCSAFDGHLAAIGDLNGDGRDDLVWRNEQTGRNTVWLVNGSDVVSGAELPHASVGWTLRTSGDLNGDGYLDFIWREDTTGTLDLWLMGPGFALLENRTYPPQPAAFDVVAAADADGDGMADLYWRDAVSGRNFVWLMQGTTIRSGVDLPQVDPAWVLAATGDFNGDGRSDLVWQMRDGGRLDFWLMNVGAFASDMIVPPLWRQLRIP